MVLYPAWYNEKYPSEIVLHLMATSRRTSNIKDIHFGHEELLEQPRHFPICKRANNCNSVK